VVGCLAREGSRQWSFRPLKISLTHTGDAELPEALQSILRKLKSGELPLSAYVGSPSPRKHLVPASDLRERIAIAAADERTSVRDSFRLALKVDPAHLTHNTLERENESLRKHLKSSEKSRIALHDELRKTIGDLELAQQVMEDLESKIQTIDRRPHQSQAPPPTRKSPTPPRRTPARPGEIADREHLHSLREQIRELEGKMRQYHTRRERRTDKRVEDDDDEVDVPQGGRRSPPQQRAIPRSVPPRPVPSHRPPASMGHQTQTAHHFSLTARLRPSPPLSPPSHTHQQQETMLAELRRDYARLAEENCRLKGCLQRASQSTHRGRSDGVPTPIANMDVGGAGRPAVFDEMDTVLVVPARVASQERRERAADDDPSGPVFAFKRDYTRLVQRHEGVRQSPPARPIHPAAKCPFIPLTGRSSAGLPSARRPPSAPPAATTVAAPISQRFARLSPPQQERVVSPISSVEATRPVTVQPKMSFAASATDVPMMRPVAPCYPAMVTVQPSSPQDPKRAPYTHHGAMVRPPYPQRPPSPPSPPPPPSDKRAVPVETVARWPTESRVLRDPTYRAWEGPQPSIPQEIPLPASVPRPPTPPTRPQMFPVSVPMAYPAVAMRPPPSGPSLRVPTAASAAWTRAPTEISGENGRLVRSVSHPHHPLQHDTHISMAPTRPLALPSGPQLVLPGPPPPPVQSVPLTNQASVVPGEVFQGGDGAVVVRYEYRERVSPPRGILPAYRR